MNYEALAADCYGHVMGGGKYFDQRIDEKSRLWAAMSELGFEVVVWTPETTDGIWVRWNRGKTGKYDVNPASFARWLRQVFRAEVDG